MFSFFCTQWRVGPTDKFYRYLSLKQLIIIASAPKPTVRQDVATDEWAGPGKSSIEEFVQHTKCNNYYPAFAPRRALLCTTNLQAYYQPRNHGH